MSSPPYPDKTDANIALRARFESAPPDDHRFDFAFDVDTVRDSDAKAHLAGQQAFVGQRMRHFLNNPTHELLNRNGKGALAVYPYTETVNRRAAGPSAIVYSQKPGGEVIATKEIVNLMNSGYTSEQIDENTDRNSDWDFLYHWKDQQNQSDEEPLPLYGQSSSGLEISSSLAEEIEAEERDREAAAAARKIYLTKDEVVAQIDQTLNDYTEEWKERKLPLRQNTAWKVWRKAPRGYQRSLSIANATEHVGHYEKRIAKQKEKTLENQYKHLNEVQKQCQSFKETIFQREEELFKISVWKAHQAPTRPTTTPRVRKKEPRINDDNDEIDLSSGSEIDDYDGKDIVALDESLAAHFQLERDNMEVDQVPFRAQSRNEDQEHEHEHGGNDDELDDDDPHEADVDEHNDNDDDAKSAATLAEESSDETEDDADLFKKPTKLNAGAVKRREQARKRLDYSQYASQHMDASQDVFGEILVNIDQAGSDCQVKMHKHVASKLRDHQIEGIRFLWREVVEGRTGCLLAHVMGLGKTMQA